MSAIPGIAALHSPLIGTGIQTGSAYMQKSGAADR